ncbi:hypothetical protein PR001_g506 [Phytophthora rubi]|uniref:RING-type domain-containing protein n=1 Tax=Phytophthora rubi TaxID=129364 RepID=A0A6A3P381_9STRA|nr:hypothetical protein PR001_g506 [Phytophthora rubi]
MLLSPSTPVPPQSRSGGRITPPVKAEMSITEQIARQTRKSTVLDPKNALLVMAIPDYDDYKIMQPYSCRSLSNKSKFVGGRDFVTRHNPQEVNDFKKQYSRDFGNLNRHRSILASPTSNLSTIGLFSSSSGSIGLQESPSKNGSISNNNLLSKDGALWRKAFTSTMKACWVLTEFGIQALIGPEYRLTTRTPVLPALPSPRPQRPPILTLSCRSPATSFRPETPSSLSAFSARESARKGIGVDLADEKTLAALSRLAVSTPKLRSPPSSPLKRSTKPNSESVSTPPSSGACTDGAEMLSLAPYADISWELKDECDRNQTATSFETTPATQQKNVGVSLASTAPSSSLPVVSSTTQHFAMEVSPPMLALGTLQTGQVYLFPVRNFRIRVDPLRSLQRSGYKATVSSTDFDALFLRLLDLSPFAPAEVIRRAKTALHATTAYCTSNLSFILFARYGDSIFVLSQSLKTAYSIALRKWMFGSAHVFNGERPETPQSRGWSLDDPVIKHWRLNGDADAVSTDPESMSAIESFLGTYGEHLISEWIGRSLEGASSSKSPWFTIPMPAATNCLSKSLSPGNTSTSFVANNRSEMPYAAPLFMLYDKPSAEFQVRFPVAGGLSERMAGDRMECGICWLDLMQPKVMVLKCSHYMCDPCLRLLSRRECPYCRAPIRLVCEVSECVKQEACRLLMEACRLLMEAMALEDKAPAPDLQENESALDHT